MNLDPFVSVDGIPFTISQEEIVKRRGQPLGSGRNAVGLNEFDYASVVYRFQDSGRLEEVTTQAPVVNFGNVAVPFETLRRSSGSRIRGCSSGQGLSSARGSAWPSIPMSRPG